MRAVLMTLAVMAVPVSAFLFGGGGGGCGCEQSCAPPPQPSCGCGAAPAPVAYPQPVAQPCRPRYVIVRPVEGGYSAGPVASGGYAAPALPVAAPVASSYSAPIPAPVAAPVSAGYAAPVAAPVATGGYAGAAPVSAGYSEGAAAAFASKTLSADGKCSSKELRKILEKEIVAGDANESKRAIYRVANQQFTDSQSGKGIDVICAPALISYRVATDFYCEYTKEDITCFAFQQA